jgi:hypothetical protein
VGSALGVDVAPYLAEHSDQSDHGETWHGLGLRHLPMRGDL